MSDLLELELEEVANHPVWVLGTKLRSLASTARALNRCAIHLSSPSEMGLFLVIPAGLQLSILLPQPLHVGIAGVTIHWRASATQFYFVMAAMGPDRTPA